jgi:3-oxoacyl-[acyl-carrier protein] reductase
MSEKSWDDVINTNLKGVFYLTQISIQYFLKYRKQASIVNISSLTGILGTEGQSNYAASKGGIIAFTRSLAREIAQHGIRINTIIPGLIDTDMIKNIPEKNLNSYLQRIPMNRFGAPEEVGNLVAFLLSDYSSYITGSTISIDGGFGA